MRYVVVLVASLGCNDAQAEERDPLVLWTGIVSASDETSLMGLPSKIIRMKQKAGP